MGLTRRSLLAGAACAAAVAALRPRPRPGTHAPYFAALQRTLKQAAVSRPVLLVDLDRLDANLERLLEMVRPRHWRIVAKSLPSPGLLDHLMRRSGTRRLMVFHAPFVVELARRFPDAHQLLGKPMPAAAAASSLDALAGAGLDLSRQIVWLIDSPQRLEEYAAIAAARGLRIPVAIEIDIGLHRGGVADGPTLRAMLDRLHRDGALAFRGLMGYEAHLGKAPALLGIARRAQEQAMDRYRAALEVCRQAGYPPERLLRNSGGSTTLHLWRRIDGIADELAAGSALLKPGDFELPALADYAPAAFIAAPVLKVQDGMQMPVLPALGHAQAAWNPNRRRSLFLYGGNWKAEPASPEGLTVNPLYSRSSNQELLNAPADCPLSPGDFVFLRPTQSESVLLQFGDLLAVRGGRIVARWPPLGACPSL